MSSFGQSSPKPSSPWSKPPTPEKKTSGGGWGFWESVGMKSTPKKESGAQPPAKPPGIFEGGYKSYTQLREAARGADFKPLPGTSRPLGKEERVKLMQELEQYGKKAGQSFGLSEQSFRERILPQIKKDLSEIYRRAGTTESREYKELERKRQLWEKGFPK